MAIHDNELKISNISYTNKDFPAIYSEILDLTSKISPKWKPESSNESDPGVVILKLAALVGDKLNYNTDKNTLEHYPLSATQDTSMRELCDMLGYNMHYYIAPVVDVTFSYVGKKLNLAEGEELIKSITFPRLSTIVSDTEGTVTYVLKENLDITSFSRTRTAEFIEGSLKEFIVGDTNIITLDNLDDNNRLYFTERQVAENGVFIQLVDLVNTTNNSNEMWEKVTNLNTQELGRKIFKFGFDSKKNLPYIEFPSDINNLIGNGLSIRYITTAGESGNISSKVLSKLVTPTSLSIQNTEGEIISFTDDEESSLVITNNAASISGKDPETIDEAYSSYKKVVGTFDTLVTCRDYANKIYDMMVEDAYVVSNCQVTDRRTDLNYSKNIVTYGLNGQVKTSIMTDEITPYTLCLYPLNPFIGEITQENYNNSFKVKRDASIIKNSLEYELNTISHDYRHYPNYKVAAGISNDYDIYLIKNVMNLNGKINTTYKVNSYEETIIKTNVWKKLFNSYNAGEVDYGYEIPYDLIFKTISESDTRIKTLSLDEPTYTVAVMDQNNNVIPYCEYKSDSYFSPYIKILGKNVVEGKVELFDYNDNFNVSLGQKQVTGKGPVIEEVKSVSTSASITVSTTDTSLRDNEVVQLIGPNLVDKIEYAAYVNYNWKSSSSIPAKVDYKITGNDVLTINITDDTGAEKNIEYKSGDIINSSFVITPTPDYAEGVIPSPTPILKHKADGTAFWVYGISTNNSIIIRGIVEHTFKSITNCCWLLDELETQNKFGGPASDAKHKFTQIGTSGLYEYILNEGEYFIYSIDGEITYEVLGSGTSIIIPNTTLSLFTQAGSCTIPSLEDLSNLGAKILKNIWKSLTFSSESYMTLQENKILTLTSGDTVRLSSGDSITLSNTLASLNLGSGKFVYKIFGEDSEEEIEAYQIDSLAVHNWRIHSRLDLNVGPNKPQKLQTGQTVDVTTKAGNTVNFVAGESFKTNMEISKAGGDDISLMYSALSDTVSYPVSFLLYEDSEIIATHPLSVIDNFTQFKIKELIETGEDAGTDEWDHTFDVLPQTEELVLVNVLLPTTESEYTVDIEIDRDETEEEDKGTVGEYNSEDTPSTSISLTTGAHILSLKGVKQVTITKSTSGIEGTVLFGKLRPLIVDATNNPYGLNSRFNLKTMAELNNTTVTRLSTNLLKYIQGVSSNDEHPFDYVCEIDKTGAIEVSDLSSPLALFDPNNVANKFVLPFIDKDNSSIEITRGSKL